MRRAIRFAFAACVLALLAGCKSNNADGRLVGTWVSNSLPNAPPGVAMTWVFGADKSFRMTVQGTGGSKTITGTYRPSFGDAVYIEHLSEPVSGKNLLEDNITVNGNQMTARDPDGTTATFTKQ
ncbi:MAG TPA: hypothetical protein VMS17_16375 [Gemmataceae bacterium]|nr:hypothetical protein [Gemmataceae bacterium]